MPSPDQVFDLTANEWQDHYILFEDLFLSGVNGIKVVDNQKSEPSLLLI